MKRTPMTRDTLKPKRCAQCRDVFQPSRTMQKVCGVTCATEHAKRLAAQKAARANKAERKSLREALEKAKTRGAHLKELQTAFNAWVRARDAGKPCISCGRFGQDMQAGHYRSVGSSPATRFMPNNCWLQCRQCNLYQHGSPISYRINLIKRIGLEAVEELEKDHPPLKLTLAEILEMKAYYRARTRDLKRASVNQLEESYV
jgi:5-methylcytosine-specific restriction endonuclease McrA